jgi:hypothetical protein
MKARRTLMLAVLAAVAVAPAAAQEGLEGRWTLAFQVGTDSEIAGDVLSSVDGELFERSVVIDSRRYRDMYNPDIRLQGLVGFGVTPAGEIFARASYYRIESPGGVESGTVAGDPLFALMGPYEEWGAELGYRFYLASRARLKSYIAPVGGVRFLDRILLDLFAPDRGSAIYNLPQFDLSTVAVFGLDLGFTFDLTTNLYVGLEAGLRYQTKPVPGPTPPGLAGINADGDRWSAPVVVTLGVRF